MEIVQNPEDLGAFPEFGMGYQIARQSGNGRGLFVVFNSSLAISAKELRRIRAGDERLLSNFIHAVRYSYDHNPRIDLPVSRFEIENDPGVVAEFVGLDRHTGFRDHPKAHGSPPHPGYTLPGDRFVRYSLFKNDRRIAGDRALPGTYAAPASERASIHGAGAAIGRFALPSPLPPIHEFEIRPDPGTMILFGAVEPKHGQAGGGVEVEFVNGTTYSTASYTGTIRLY